MPHPGASGDHFKIRFRCSARSLPKEDLFTRSDPVLYVYHSVPGAGSPSAAAAAGGRSPAGKPASDWQLVDHSEITANLHSSDWQKEFLVEGEAAEFVKLSIFDHDHAGKPGKEIGWIELELSQLVASSGLLIPLGHDQPAKVQRLQKKQSAILIYAHNCDDEIECRFMVSCRNLIKPTSGGYGEQLLLNPDLFCQLSTIHQRPAPGRNLEIFAEASEVVENSYSPEFQVVFTLRGLPSQHLRLAVFHRASRGADGRAGVPGKELGAVQVMLGKLEDLHERDLFLQSPTAEGQEALDNAGSVLQLRLVSVKASELASENLSPEEISSVSFEDFIETRIGFESFLSFLECERAQENLLFWLDVQHYKQLHLKPQDLFLWGLKIYRRFVAPDAPLQVNLSSEVRQNITAQVEELAAVFDSQVDGVELKEDTADSLPSESHMRDSWLAPGAAVDDLAGYSSMQTLGYHTRSMAPAPPGGLRPSPSSSRTGTTNEAHSSGPGRGTGNNVSSPPLRRSRTSIFHLIGGGGGGGGGSASAASTPSAAAAAGGNPSFQFHFMTSTPSSPVTPLVAADVVSVTPEAAMKLAKPPVSLLPEVPRPIVSVPASPKPSGLTPVAVASSHSPVVAVGGSSAPFSAFVRVRTASPYSEFYSSSAPPVVSSSVLAEDDGGLMSVPMVRSPRSPSDDLPLSRSSSRNDRVAPDGTGLFAVPAASPQSPPAPLAMPPIHRSRTLLSNQLPRSLQASAAASPQVIPPLAIVSPGAGGRSVGNGSSPPVHAEAEQLPLSRTHTALATPTSANRGFVGRRGRRLSRPNSIMDQLSVLSQPPTPQASGAGVNTSPALISNARAAIEVQDALAKYYTTVPRLFDDGVRRVVALMEKDSWRRFQRSLRFKGVIGNVLSRRRNLQVKSNPLDQAIFDIQQVLSRRGTDELDEQAKGLLERKLKKLLDRKTASNDSSARLCAGI